MRIVRKFLFGIELLFTVALLCWVVLVIAVKLERLESDLLKGGERSVIIRDRYGNYLFELPLGPIGEWSLPLRGDKIPRNVRVATLAAEDHRFDFHPGVDLFSLFRAVWGNLTGTRRRSGASTIAMQLARILRPARRTYANKLRESYLALVLTDKLGRERILLEYLNRAPYGNRTRGIERAARLYFSRPAEDLTLAQAAFLAGLPWAPAALNPYTKEGYSRALRRMRWILKRAREFGWISADEYSEALRQPIAISPRPTRANSAIHFTEKILNLLKKKYKKTKDSAPLELYTTLDLELQRRLETLLRRRVFKWWKNGARTGALVVLDHRTGELLAYVGSPGYFLKGSKGAIDYVQVLHSPGSTLKPFIYALALEKLHFTGATLLPDVASSFLWKGGNYLPHNDDKRFFGPIRLRMALGNSRNIPAIWTLAQLGIGRAKEFLNRLGFSFARSGGELGLGLAIGGVEVSLWELVRAYAVLGRSGRGVKVRWLREAVSRGGGRFAVPGEWELLFGPQLSEEQLIDRDSARVILDILSDPLARLPTFSRYSALEYDYPVAVKTGTSQGYRDSLTVGVSSRFAVGCWIGRPEPATMVGSSGGKVCAPLVKDSFGVILERYREFRPSEFPRPEGWYRVKICPISGAPVGPNCSGSLEEWYPKNWVPDNSVCPFHRRVAIDRRNNLRAGEGCPKEFVVYHPVLFLPPKYAAWGSILGERIFSPVFSPLCPPKGAEKREGVAIVYPPSGSVFLKDPTLPEEYSTIELRAQSYYPHRYLVWFKDSKVVGKVPWPYTYHWKLERGVHRFAVTTPDGRLRSQEVRVIVK